MRDIMDEVAETVGIPKNKLTGCFAETFIKAYWVKKGYELEKLCEYNKGLILRKEQIIKLLNKSKLSFERKAALMFCFERKRFGLPDFIVLSPNKNIFFIESKYNGSQLSDEQIERKKELEGLGFVYLTKRVGKIKPAATPVKKEGFFRRLFRRKPKLVTTHQLN